MNKIYAHPGQPEMQVEVILASKHPLMDQPLITLRARYPRIIHGEIMTHRVFSRNARSSRAVPVKTMLNEVREKPFVPWHWGRNQKGMQAGESFSEGEIRDFEAAWRNASIEAACKTELMMGWGVHKQIPNRLLEPYSWIDTLITTNEWSNFLWLRDHKDAEPHLQDFARLVKQALDEMEVQELKEGEWHLPYINLHDKDHGNSICGIRGDDVDEYLRKISAARCARISYKPFDGDASYERELERYDLLVNSDRVHASPTEHQATPDRRMRSAFDDDRMWVSSNLHGNLKGWIQARKLIPNECYRG